MTARTRAGYLKFRPAGPGSRVALVAPASAFKQEHFDTGVAELRRLGFDPVWSPDVFERQAFTAGPARLRAGALVDACDTRQADAVIAVRGGYGSVQLLPWLDVDRLRAARTALVGYSDVTSVHSFLSAHVGLASVHGPMLEGRLSAGPDAYDPVTFLRSLSTEPLGELAPAGLETLWPGEASGPLVGGTLTQILASFETPYAFSPPAGHVLFLDEVGERPYRLHRMLTQLRLTGRLAQSRAIVFGQLPRCDEPGGAVTSKDVVREVLDDFPGPVLFGFPSGHTTSPLVSVPLGVNVHVVGGPDPRIVFDEAGAAA